MKKNSLYAYYPCFLFSLIILIVTSCRNGSDSPFSESAKNALSTLEIAPPFQIELVASEPFISDPVDMMIDEYGKMYVVEMHGYPLDESGTGKIKLLTDSNGDGQIDNSIVFADGLTLPTGIMRWKNGVLVTDAPDVLYLEDSDGDGKADIREILLTGFALSNPQHNLNNPMYGLDNWIYLAHESTVATQSYKEEFGDDGKEIIYPGKPEGPRLPKNANGRNVRFRPGSHELEMTAAASQFGQTFDSWGNHFLLNNSNHIYQELIAERYLQRNPDQLITKVTRTLSDHGQPADVFPITKDPQHQLLTTVGVFTSASGLEMYQGGAFSEDFNHVSFVAEPVNNLVHADYIKDDGVSFKASRVYHQKEFLASTDSWFRPVNMYTGPDGALYVLDYYRKFIEHPEWMAKEVVESGELYEGTDKGRIYRITPIGSKRTDRSKNLNLGDASLEQLVGALANTNIWWRKNAQRLLIDRKAKEAIPLLKEMAINFEAPLGRLHALWTLEGLGQLGPEMIKRALMDPVSGIRENAIRLAELHLNKTPGLSDALLSLKEDTDIKVRYQLLLTLGFVDTPAVSQARQDLLFKDIEDEWFQIAALSASSVQHSTLLDAVIAHAKGNVSVYTSLIHKLSAMIGRSGNLKEIQRQAQRATKKDSEEVAEWQAAVLKGLAQGIKSKKLVASDFQGIQNSLIRAFFEHPSESVGEGCLRMLQVIGLPNSSISATALNRAEKTIRNKNQSMERRAGAVYFLALDNPESHIPLLKGLITPGEALPVQLAALRTLSATPGQTISGYLLEQWKVLSPEVRKAAIQTFLKDPVRVKLLLDAIDAGEIQKTNLDQGHKIQLMTQQDQALKDRARTMFAENDDHQRQEIIEQYESALELKGNSLEGKQVFLQNCASCHQIGGAIGTGFGPDLATIRNRRPASILNDIINPAQSIADGFDLWTVTLNDGESIQGVVSAETPTAITLQQIGGQETTISRANIKSLIPLGMSAMPVGLENNIDLQEMADLLAYIRDVK
ncbi:Cytochrome c6 [Arenibacter antarcticus]|uniref:PVC-type heme-binding CxxCH protein n=1 Tax=Arenibacter antarcticus TaxID=2040469 RepID=A0ABW5VJ68_9FLAO|nr:PVC-type heme-binding CxxCH protein [Arenibacter sp. H213]MCM4167015.1 dehydrogenase [Arenibacter sp. H213]